MRVIPGHEGRYHITREGRVFDQARKKWLKVEFDNSLGCIRVYLAVVICGKYKKHERFSIPKILISVFKNERTGTKTKIIYIDGNRENIHLSNITTKKKRDDENENTQITQSIEDASWTGADDTYI